MKTLGAQGTLLGMGSVCLEQHPEWPSRTAGLSLKTKQSTSGAGKTQTPPGQPRSTKAGAALFLDKATFAPPQPTNLHFIIGKHHWPHWSNVYPSGQQHLRNLTANFAKLLYPISCSVNWFVFSVLCLCRSPICKFFSRKFQAFLKSSRIKSQIRTEIIKWIHFSEIIVQD